MSNKRRRSHTRVLVADDHKVAKPSVDPVNDVLRGDLHHVHCLVHPLKTWNAHLAADRPDVMFAVTEGVGVQDGLPLPVRE